MGKKKLSFGCYIYQEGLEYNEIKRIVIECEKLGFDSVWLKDNFGSWLDTYLSCNRPIGKEENKDTIAKKDNSNESFLECCTSYFIIHFADLPNLTSLKLFGKYVIPHFLH